MGAAVDYILFIKPSAEVTLEANPNEVREARWVTQEELRAMTADEALVFTPWFKLIAQSTLYKWWDRLDDLSAYLNDAQIHRMIDAPKE